MEKYAVLNIFLLGSLLVIAFHYLLIFLLRSHRLYFLYFSIFCFIISLWLTVSGEAHLLAYFNLSSAIIYKLSLIRYLAIPFFSLFLAEIFPDEFSERVLILCQILGIGFYVFVLISPLAVISNVLIYNIFSLLFVAYCLSIVIQALVKGDKKATLFLFNFIFLFSIITNDLLNYFVLIRTGFYFLPGVIIFIFIQSMILTKISADNFQQVEKELSILNEEKDYLLQKTRIKDEFLAGTTENLLTPLKIIVSSAESILHNVLNIESELKSDLIRIIHNSRGLDYLLHNFIDFINMEEKELLVNKEKMELSEIINNIMNFFEFYVAEKNIEFINTIKRKDYIIIVDKSRFIQIIFNLIDDILKFINKGKVYFTADEGEKGKIVINLEINAADIMYKYPGNDLSKNNGSDIYSDETDFRQKITEKLLKLQDGELKIKKNGNHNLNIMIIIPGEKYSDYYLEEEKITDKQVNNREVENREVDNLDKAEESDEEIFGEEKKIIVLNENNNVNFLGDILLLKDYYLQELENREQVFAALNNQVVLLILNIFAPDKMTLEFCRKIRERFSLFELPILIMSSRSMPENLIAGFEIGINDFIKKPFEVSEFKARIRTLITLKEKVEESVKREQDYLRAQIKPHFLYNTLDSIAYLCQVDPEQANKLILALAGYLRYSFDFDNLDQLVSIHKELELVKFYLSIQKERFKDKINVEYNIKDDIDFSVPPLVLQSLIENAIKHGLAGKEKGGTIKITIKRDSKYYLVKVADDGVGITARRLASIFKKEEDNERKKIGLKNINQRLKKIYDEELVIKSKKDEGTEVSFRVPV